MNMPTYRSLSEKEIATLTVYGCTADNWSNVQVVEDFSPAYVSNVHFSGSNRLGKFETIFSLSGGLQKHAGIFNCVLHNCEIGDNVFIDKINNYIANYKIDEGTYIENVNLMLVDGPSKFGNGVKVPVMNECGGREIPIFDQLSAPLAYMLILYRYRPFVIQRLLKLIDEYAEMQESSIGFVSKNVRIVNCGSLINVRIGSHAVIESASLLQNGSINSNEQAPVMIGSGVKCNDFILSSSVSVTDSTLISRCFIGQGCIMGKQFSALDSLFFSNCQGLHGEATAVFAGPYTVSHHKSTLLIGGMFSFLNAGSGTNQSNHMYKLGPVHQGICERGSKTSSDSYLLWPAKIGAFTLVMGRHYKHSDTSDLPFSYLIENITESFLVPGVNLRSVGTIRDAQKWPKRDNRKDTNKLDQINFNLLSPYSVGKMMKAIEVLQNLQRNEGENTEIYTYQNCRIKNASLRNGIDYYNLAVRKFLGNSLISRLQPIEFKNIEEVIARLKPDTDIGTGEWIDLSGLIAPKKLIEDLMLSVENGTMNLVDIQHYFENIHAQYDLYEWTWAVEQIENRWGKSLDKMQLIDLIQIIENWIESVVKLDQFIYNDAKKEFDLNSKTSFGVDGNEEQKYQDFEFVRGSFENNPFVLEVLNHIKTKTELGNELIDRLKRIDNHIIN